MNVYKSSFLIIGKGVTYDYCSEFFNNNSIIYDSLDTNDAVNFTDGIIYLNDRRINLSEFDYVIISPGIPKNNSFIKYIEAQKCKIITDIEIIQNLSQSKFIIVTGTNGKTSTVNLLADILNDNQKKALACGNNGVSVFKSLENSYDFIVLELSSYQLEYINNLKSEIAIILNLSQDHIERHLSLENYLKTKLKAFKNTKYSIMNKNINANCADILFEVKCNQFFINEKAIKNLSVHNYEYIKYLENIYSINGKHELDNLCACISVLHLLDISTENILNSFAKRTQLSHRLEKLYSLGSNIFINDSKSTNAHSTFTALESIDGNIILIMGGDHKEISYKSLTNIINDKVKLLILIGDNKNYLKNDLSVNIETIILDDLESAVNYIFSVMNSGDIILLSPGTSSFYSYSNYKKRGNHFKELIGSHVSRKN